MAEKLGRKRHYYDILENINEAVLLPSVPSAHYKT